MIRGRRRSRVNGVPRGSCSPLLGSSPASRERVCIGMRTRLAEEKKGHRRTRTQKVPVRTQSKYVSDTRKQAQRQRQTKCQKGKGKVHAPACARKCSQNAARRHEPGRTNADRGKGLNNMSIVIPNFIRETSLKRLIQPFGIRSQIKAKP